jgi:hypothetical protein
MAHGFNLMPRYKPDDLPARYNLTSKDIKRLTGWSRGALASYIDNAHKPLPHAVTISGAKTRLWFNKHDVEVWMLNKGLSLPKPLGLGNIDYR